MTTLKDKQLTQALKTFKEMSNIVEIEATFDDNNKRKLTITICESDYEESNNAPIKLEID